MKGAQNIDARFSALRESIAKSQMDAALKSELIETVGRWQASHAKMCETIAEATALRANIARQQEYWDARRQEYLDRTTARVAFQERATKLILASAAGIWLYLAYMVVTL